jgi:cyanocobalamin reductase (cyanide-eliminating) / alkylcobalamin dealkylase
VAADFQLSYDYDTLAFIVISTPAMFDQAFKPFVCRTDCSEESGRDLIDECISHQFKNVCQV